MLLFVVRKHFFLVFCINVKHESTQEWRFKTWKLLAHSYMQFELISRSGTFIQSYHAFPLFLPLILHYVFLLASMNFKCRIDLVDKQIIIMNNLEP